MSLALRWLHNKVSADEFQMTVTPARPARWIANGRTDLALVAIEIATENGRTLFQLTINNG
jgi:hypothetical protein